jgi:hypothetical protein
LSGEIGIYGPAEHYQKVCGDDDPDGRPEVSLFSGGRSQATATDIAPIEVQANNANPEQKTEQIPDHRPFAAFRFFGCGSLKLRGNSTPHHGHALNTIMLLPPSSTWTPTSRYFGQWTMGTSSSVTANSSCEQQNFIDAPWCLYA